MIRARGEDAQRNSRLPDWRASVEDRGSHSRSEHLGLEFEFDVELARDVVRYSLRQVQYLSTGRAAIVDQHQRVPGPDARVVVPVPLPARLFHQLRRRHLETVAGVERIYIQASPQPIKLAGRQGRILECAAGVADLSRVGQFATPYANHGFGYQSRA